MGDKDRMQPKKVATMPVCVHEYEVFRMERANKRLCAAFAVTASALIATIFYFFKR